MSDSKVEAKRGRAYSCPECEWTGEKSQSVTHYVKKHCELSKAPFACTLCKFKGGTEDQLRVHAKSRWHKNRRCWNARRWCAKTKEEWSHDFREIWRIISSREPKDLEWKRSLKKTGLDKNSHQYRINPRLPQESKATPCPFHHPAAAAAVHHLQVHPIPLDLRSRTRNHLRQILNPPQRRSGKHLLHQQIRALRAVLYLISMKAFSRKKKTVHPPKIPKILALKYRRQMTHPQKIHTTQPLGRY